jgi:DinB superfamily
MDTYLERLQEAVVSATHGMSAEELSRHPEGKWSTAEVLEHLYLTYRGTVKGLERCLQDGKPLARARTMRDRARSAVVVGLGYMPKGRKAPERALPRGMPTQEVFEAIGPQIKAMAELISRCEVRFGRGFSTILSSDH